MLKLQLGLWGDWTGGFSPKEMQGFIFLPSSSLSVGLILFHAIFLHEA
jgi:hypothetical protein